MAWIDGAPAAFDAAVAEAARAVRTSALPLFAHLGTDVEGAREAVLLAECAGGVLDHAASAALLADLDPLRESGAFQTTPLEAGVRADVVLILGDLAAPGWLARPRERRTLRLGAAETGVGAARLGYLAALRARVKGRPVAPSLEPHAQTLRDAKFGVAVWSAEALEPLAIEAVHGLVRDLNETTRFSTLPAAAPDNGLGVQATLGWMTGFSLRTGFARGYPEHDPWRFNSRRLIAAGETECVIRVCAFEGEITVGERVRFAVARPGEASAAALYDAAVGALVATCAASPSNAPTAASVLAAIRARVEAC